jgi:Skp family chaperone for outer membrane proteins
MRLLSGFAAALVAGVCVMPASVEAGQAPQARLPFPPDARYAYVDPTRVFAESADGRAASQQLQRLVEQKQLEISGRQQALQASQQQLQQNASVMSPEAQLALQQQINDLNLEIQRMTEDAQAELAQLEQQLQLAFQTKFNPALNQVATSRRLHFVFNAVAGALVWADPALDISADVIQEIDRASGGE